MIRVRTHTARKGGRRCGVCLCEIRPGDRYRERVTTEGDGDRGWGRHLVHTSCAGREPGWDETPPWPGYDDASLDYVRDRYGLQVHARDRVTAGHTDGASRAGVVVRGTHYVHVLHDGDRRLSLYHPHDVKLDTSTHRSP